jgi:hypothetical protein
MELQFVRLILNLPRSQTVVLKLKLEVMWILRCFCQCGYGYNFRSVHSTYLKNITTPKKNKNMLTH